MNLHHQRIDLQTQWEAADSISDTRTCNWLELKIANIDRQIEIATLTDTVEALTRLVLNHLPPIEK